MLKSVKSKIRAGTIFLFSLLLISGGIGIFYLVQLKKDAQAILTNNYESIDYCQKMLSAVDSISLDPEKSKAIINKSLVLQQNNITEPGEEFLTTGLANSVQQLYADGNSSTVLMKVRSSLMGIIRLNMLAIESKNKKAQETAETALTYLTLIATIILIIAITFAYNFPFIITDPIRKLTEAIHQIEEKNYRYRIHLDQKDEFGKMANAYNSMAARLEFFESSNLNQILFEKSRAEAVINSLKDASIGIDKTNKILFANDQALQLLGLQAQDIVGHSVNDLKSSNDLFRFLVEEKSQAPFKIVFNNRENYFIRELIDIQQKDGQGNKMIILKNITSFKELDVAKTNFIATISHELKTPLASSDFGLKLLEDARVSSLSEEQQNIVKHLREDNQRMLRILSELLNMSQVEAGKIEIHPQKVSASDAINEGIETVQKAADEKNIEIIQDVPENLNMVIADQEKLVWVLNNLLTNAIKYSPIGGNILINAREDEDSVVISVKDEGQGIESKYIDFIFTRYFRIPGTAGPGNGLGLAISRDFVEAMNGSIHVDSQPGHGSEFSVRLPVAT